MGKYSEENAKAELERRKKKFSEEDVKRVIDKEKEIESKFKTQNKLTQFTNDFKVIFAMINDYYHGRYKEVPWYVITAAGAALLYVLSPMDLIFDFIPIGGYIDDAAVFLFCMNQIRGEIEKYKVWKEYEMPSSE
ncbi:YkvA family protein [Massilibacteroides sp.]|uniref:YkvA family protein n=1 Tax=Massilibacteroides sp. TaxID=2034766 RepID=UPI00262B4E98|nr:YkvA family protein [Massilibacteroides sp.]MDD4515214.1 YkvA family protein [Massilibacteroides sp.]